VTAGRQPDLADAATGRSCCSSGPTSCSLDCRAVAERLQADRAHESQAAAAERIAYGVLVAALEEGLVTTLQHARDVLRRFSAPAGALGEPWLREQERRLREDANDPDDLRCQRPRRACPDCLCLTRTKEEAREGEHTWISERGRDQSMGDSAERPVSCGAE
jgi:hypothetical protein